MKVSVGSDLHIEFGQFDIRNTDNADVLILGGDVIIGVDFEPTSNKYSSKKNRDYHNFFSQASAEFNDVIYLMGNHEHYHGDFAKTENHIRECLAQYKNIHFLECNSMTIGNITFVGGTLWTDMNKRDVLTMLHLRHQMNDFQYVNNSNTMVLRKVPKYKKDSNGKVIKDEHGIQIFDGYGRKKEPSKFQPLDAANEFDKTFGYIQGVVNENPTCKFWVCTHHSPTRQSTPDCYRHDYLMNGGFSSELDEWIIDHPQVKVWSHGHTHHQFDYTIGDTRIVCNPRGYFRHEPQASEFKLVTLEV